MLFNVISYKIIVILYLRVVIKAIILVGCFVQVTAVGHAAILAAIQKYVPALVSFTLYLVNDTHRI